MLTDQEFESLLHRLEGDTLDFKATGYDLSNEGDKFGLIKDVICMANTPRVETSYIILGVKKYPNSSFGLLGLDQHIDEADLQSQFSEERVYPTPRFSYGLISYASKKFGIIAIPPDRVGPCVPRKDFRNVLRQNQVYFRRGSKNDVARPEDIVRIGVWIHSSDQASVHATHQLAEAVPAWERLFEAVHGFESSRRYILFANLGEADDFQDIGAIGAVNWCAVFDFDPFSEERSLLKAARGRLESHRSLHIVAPNNRPTLNLDRGTYWYFAKGLAGYDMTPIPSTWLEWRQRYGNELKGQLTNLAKAAIPMPTTVLAIWYGDGLEDHLQSMLDDTLATFADTAEFVVVAKDLEGLQRLQPIADKFNATLVDMPLHHLCSGLESVAPLKPGLAQEGCSLPSSSGVPLSLGPSDVQWIEEEIELVHLTAVLVWMYGITAVLEPSC